MDCEYYNKVNAETAEETFDLAIDGLKEEDLQATNTVY